MTALYAILAVLLLGDLMTGVYLVGFGDGVTAEQMRRSLQPISNEDTAEGGGNNTRHTLTHADLAQLEQETIDKNKQN